MRKFVLIFLFLIFILPISALELTRDKNVATYIFFPLIDSADNVSLQSGATALDSEIDTFADGTAPNGFADCTNEATEISTSGQYYLSLTASEMNADYIMIQVKASDALTQTILISTRLKEAVDTVDTVADSILDDTGTSGVLLSGTPNVNVTQISGDSTAADNAESVFDNTGYTMSNSTVGTVTALTGHTAQTGDGYALLTNVTYGLSAIETLVDELETRLTAARAGYLDNLNGHTPQTGDSYAEVTSITYGLSVIEGLVDDLESRLTTGRATNLDNLDAAISTRSTVTTSQVNTEVDAALFDIHLDHIFATDYDPASKPGTATALLNEIIENDGGVSRLTANALEQAPTGGANPNVLIDTTMATVGSQTSLTLTAGSDVDDAYNDQAIVLYDASNNDYPSVRVVSDYTGSTKTVTLDNAPDFTIIAGDGVKVFTTAPGTVAPTAAAIRAEIDTNSTQLAAIVADTNELQTDWVNSGRLDLLLDAVKAQTDTLTFTGSDINATLDGEQVTVSDIVAAALAKFFSVDSTTSYGAAVGGSVVKEIADNAGGGSGLTAQETRDAMKLAPSVGAAAAGSVDAHLDDILADTAELQGDLADGGRLDLLVDAIKAATDLLTFTGTDLQVTLDGEQVTVATNNDKTGYSVSAATAAFLQDFFIEDSGETYSSAVVGSVIKEIADNASAVAAKDWSTEENTNIYTEINGLRDYLVSKMKVHRG